MGIYIKDMEMPSGCGECPLNNDSICLLHPYHGYDPGNGTTRREDCPLVWIPENSYLLVGKERARLCLAHSDHEVTEYCVEGPCEMDCQAERRE